MFIVSTSNIQQFPLEYQSDSLKFRLLTYIKQFKRLCFYVKSTYFKSESVNVYVDYFLFKKLYA